MQRKVKEIIFVFFVLALVWGAAGCSDSSGGVVQNGSAEYPFLISHGSHLSKIGSNSTWTLDKYYKLSTSITIEVNWKPMGTPDKPFTGSFDADGHWIHGFELERPDLAYNGLFGYLGKGGVIKNLHLGVGTLIGGQYTGILTGYNAGSIINCEIDGDVLSEGDYVGGITGFNDGLIQASEHEGQVSGRDIVGGLAGKNTGTISHGYHNGVIRGRRAGGAAALNSGRLEKIEANGEVYGTYRIYDGNSEKGGVGGLTGYSNSGEIIECLSYNTVYGEDNVGGLLGSSENDEISDSFVQKSVDAMDNHGENIGLFIGKAFNSMIKRCHSGSGSLNHTDNAEYVGEFIGFVENTDIESCFRISNSDNYQPYGNKEIDDRVIKISEEEAKDETVFIEAGFDFENVWIIDTEKPSVPILRWKFDQRI